MRKTRNMLITEANTVGDGSIELRDGSTDKESMIEAFNSTTFPTSMPLILSSREPTSGE